MSAPIPVVSPLFLYDGTYVLVRSHLIAIPYKDSGSTGTFLVLSTNLVRCEYRDRTRIYGISRCTMYLPLHVSPKIVPFLVTLRDDSD